MKHSLSRPASVFVFSLLVVLLSSPAIAARTLPAWTPPASENANSADPATGLDYRIGEWLFQPGETTATPPSPGDWEIVRVPFLWTSGNSRLVKPAPGEPPLAAWTKKPSEWKNHDNGWFERAITIPAAWAGQRVWLAFDQIECDALLWTGGDAAAAAPILLSGPEARVDITPRIQPGKTTTLRLWVTRWWRDIPRAMDDAPLRREALKTTASNTKGGLDAVRKTLPAGIPGYVTLQVRPAAAEITGIFARPSYREKTLTADVDIAIPGTGKPPAASAPDRATAAAAATALRIRITDPEGRGGALPDAVTVPLTLPAPPPPAPAAETVNTRTVTIPWPAPRLWQLGDGYLYQLRAELLDAAGRVLHAPPPQPFGFREIHVQGREIIMNGRPVRLRLAPVIAPHWPALLFWEGIGFNAAQWHPNGGSWFVRNGQRSLVIDDEDNPGMRRITAEVIEQADRRGFALLMPSPLVSHVRTAIGTPEGAAAYERECRLWFARLRNHPSILMWNPSMNTGSSTRENAERLGMLPEGEDRVPGWAVRANEIIKRVDPTRIVAHHCGPGGEVDLPNQYLNFLPLQERIEFPSHWAEKGDIPWGAIEHGTPWLMNFMKPLDIPQFTEWHAAYFGDRAYAAETDDYVKLSADYIARGKRYPTADTWIRFAQNTLHWEFDTLFTRETNRAWRAWGVPGGWKPWNFDIGYGIPPALAGKPVKGDFFYTQLTEAEARATLAAPPPWANPVYHAWRETMQPLLAYLGGPPERFTAKDHAWRAGEKFRKTVVVVWDGNAPRALRAEWRLETGGRILQSGTLNLALRPGDIVKKPFDLQAPAVSERTDARLTLVISDAASGAGVPPASVASRSGTGFQPVDVASPPPSQSPLPPPPPPPRIEDSMTLTFWPEEPEARPQSSWALFAGGNEKHDTRAWLRTLGVEATPVKTAADLKRTAANVLVIAREALDAAPLPLDAADVARGLRVLVLEQNPAALESVGLRIQDIVTRHAFPRDRSHPALSGLAAADLANWRGEPDLLPKTKAGMKPWPLARPPHWGNQGAVASVVIETPAHGAFTPLADAEYDLACSPLLEWRHGRGGVLFCQFDITGRTAPEPAARRLAQNLVRALDAPYPVNNNKLVRYAGDDAGWAYASALGFAAERINIAAAAAPLEPRTDLLVIGPGAWKTCREKADTFAAAGGAVLVLAQPGADLAPAHLKTAPVKTARVAPEARPPALLRGIGPQLLNWRAFLAQERFDRSGQPDGARVYLDGLVLEQPRTAGNANDANGANDAGGRLVFSQLDWRALEAAEDNGGGGKNLEKPRWHTVQFYRQLLTNLGARTANDAAAVLFTPRRVAPLVNVPVWRVFNDVAQVEPVQKDGTFPALARRFPMETAATASATAATAATADATADDRAISANIGEGEVNETGLTVASSKAGWRTYGPRGSTGRVHLDWISPAQPGKIGYARTHVYSSRPREALFAVGGDNWMVFRINGQAFVDHSKQQRAARTPFSGEFRFKAPLKAGWNLLEAKVASGSGGFGFWAMVSDPGDAHFKTNPNQGGRPENITTPPPGDLRSEPEIEAREWFYVRPLKPEDDPYRFNPW